MRNSFNLLLLPCLPLLVRACPRMSVGYAEVFPIRPVKRDNKDKPQHIEPRCWGEITFNLRLGAEKLLINTSPISAPLVSLVSLFSRSFINYR